MLETSIEFKKGVLFIRIGCKLDKENSKELKKILKPILLKNGFKYVVLNLDNVNYIDSFGIKLIDEVNDIVMKFNGKTTLIKNKRIEKILKGTLVENILYKAKNESLALGVFEL